MIKAATDLDGINLEVIVGKMLLTQTRVLTNNISLHDDDVGLLDSWQKAEVIKYPYVVQNCKAPRT